AVPPPPTAPRRPSEPHSSSGASASNRPNACGAVASGRTLSLRRANSRCTVRAEGAHPRSWSMIATMCAAVRAGRSRLSRSANSNTPASVRGCTCRSVGSNASNPPARHARIQRSRLARDTRTGSPNGPVCTRPANSRTNTPRSAEDNPGSANDRINAYRNNATSRARDARDCRLPTDITITTLSVDNTNAPTLNPQQDHSQRRGRVDPQPTQHRRLRSQKTTPPTPPPPPPPPHPRHPRAPPPPPPRPPRPPDLRHRITPRAARRRHPIQLPTRVHPLLHLRKPHPNRLSVPSEPRQPTPHRRRRTTHQRGDPPPPPPISTSPQRRPDHLHHIHPPTQQPPPQQHLPAHTPL